MAIITEIVELPAGQTGLNGSKNMSQVPITALIKATNITYENGTIQKEGGAVKYNSTAITGTPGILGGWDWNHDGSTQRMIVVLDDGTIMKDSGAGTFSTTLKSGLTVTDVVPTFTEGGKELAAQDRKLFIFTGVNPVQVLDADGATTSDLTTPPADWSGTNQPTFGEIHEGRLWAAGNANDPHRLYYSQTDDHENFTGSGSGSISIYPGEGVRVVGAVSYFGALIVFKEIGIYLVDTSSATVTEWRVKRVSKNIGTAGVRTYVQVENDILYVDQSGDIRFLSTTDEFGDVGSISVSDTQSMGPFIRDELNLSQVTKWQVQYYPTKREAHIACTSTGQTTNDRRLVLDFNAQGRTRFRFSDRDTPVSLWLRRVSNQVKLLSGDDAGFVWTLDDDTRSKDGAGYAGQFQTPHFDLSHIDPQLATRRKNGQFIEIVSEPKGNWDLTMDVYWDGTYRETVTFNMGVTGAVLGSFVLDTDRLSGDSIVNRRARITGSGRRISLLGKNDSAGEDFSVARIFFFYTLGEDTI